MLDKEKIETIREQYAGHRESAMERLEKMDRKAKTPAKIFGFTFGVIGALVLGVGMCLAMQVIGSGVTATVFGVIIGVVGIAMIVSNYFIYRKIEEKGKAKYSAKILELSGKMLHVSD